MFASQLTLLAPGDTAALINSTFVFVSALINLISPWIGNASDRNGRRPVLIAGSVIMFFSTILLIAGSGIPIFEHTPLPPSSPSAKGASASSPAPAKSGAALVIYLIGYTVLNVGLTVYGVMVASLVSDFSALRPSLSANISGAFYLFFYIGSIVGLLAGAEVLPPDDKQNGFYWFLAALFIGVTLHVHFLPPAAYKAQYAMPLASAEPTLDGTLLRNSSASQKAPRDSSGSTLAAAAPSGHRGSGGGSGSGGVAGEPRRGGGGAEPALSVPTGSSRRASRPPASTRRTGGASPLARVPPLPPVVLARTLFYFASGIFQSTSLYFVENHIKHKGMKGINVAGFAAVTAIIIAIVLAVPVGHIAKRVGAVPTVVVSSFLMAGLMCPYGFIETISELMMLSVAFGTALVCFCIADITLIVQTLPDQSMSGQDIGLWNMFHHWRRDRRRLLRAGAHRVRDADAEHDRIHHRVRRRRQSGGGTYYAVAGYRIVYFTAAGVG